MSAHEAIDRDFAAHLERIRDFLRIPSISAADGDLRTTADAVCELIAAAGGTAAPREPGEKRPTVIGVIDGPGPTVLRYGMYDVQPTGAQWTVDPFAAEIRDGRLIARGAANSKGALAASILAFASVPSPCRQVFVCEGEEELGSPRLAAFTDAHRDELAADYAVQLARNAGKVVFFAKHLDVMDAAEELFARRGVGSTSIRGDQTRTARDEAIYSFTHDPDVHVIVCSLTAAGVGINLQVSSNVVLSELSWTNAEQTQAIDRVHRIGQTEPVTAWRIIAAQTIAAKINSASTK